MTFKTSEDREAVHALDGEWLQPESSPFLHGCCRCSLMHTVRYRVVDKEGEPVEGYDIQLQFTLNPTETIRLEEYVEQKNKLTQP